MTTAAGIGADAQGDSTLSTPVASQTKFSPSKDSVSHVPQSRGDHQLSDLPTSSTLSPGSNLSSGGPLLLPIPNSGSNRSQMSLTPSDDEGYSVMFHPLPDEIANADISIAHDGSFVETSSGAAARELKKRYDEQLGVGNPSRSTYSVSPFAITAFVNQHGTQMFRVGRRDLSPPALSASEDSDRQIIYHKSGGQSASRIQGSTSPHRRRRSRMSMHALLPPAMFGNGTTTPSPMYPATTDGTRSPPKRRLRKTRSLTNMFGVANGVSPQAVEGPSTAAIGRPHAHSVTGANLPPMPIELESPSHSTPSRDIFSDVMQWSAEGALYSSSVSASTDEIDSRLILRRPFGRGVSFDSPSYRPFNDQLTIPPVLREMQSFESDLTARIDPGSGNKSKLTSRTTSDQENKEPAVASPVPLPARSASRIGASPSLETRMHSRYSTEVFDVLQSFRGLPLLDKLLQTSNETTVIRLSTRSETSAAPKDDPRFIIWGDINPSDEDATDAISLSHDSHTDQSSYSGPSRRSMKSKGSTSLHSDPAQVRSTAGAPQKALVAATIERWIAQLTSELNYDELLIFFLTYRTYVSAVDLCHLLICRFHWAVEQSASLHDDMVKRIVRVRTFIAIRYWLLTFFTVDFVPNRELRVLFANWLNTLGKDPTLENTKDVLDIVRKLKKVAKECKDAQASKSRTSTDKRFSAQSRKSESMLCEDSDVDLDFLPNDGSGYSGQSFGVSTPASVAPTADMAILQQPLQLAILQHSKPSDVALIGPFIPNAATLPFHHGPLSRAFVNTIGRLGRWKRVLNSRNSVRTSHAGAVDVSPFHLEPNATGDLLTVRGGVEQYLKLIQTQTPRSPSTSINTPPSLPSLPSSPIKERNVTVPATKMSPTAERKLAEPLHVVSEESEEDLESQPVSAERSVSPSSYDSELSRRQTSGSLEGEGSYQQQLTKPNWQIDVVSIDELELSDMSSSEDQEEPEVPPGLRRVRKLPLRRDFEFVRRSVSSIAAKTRDSIASITSSIASSVSAEPELGSSIQQWQVNALVDSLSDDDEAGDVDAALRHLEGRISHSKQLVKQSKVDNWVKSIRERMVAGDYGNERSRFPVDDDEQTSECDGREFGTLERDSPTHRRKSMASDNEDPEDFHVSMSNSDMPLASQYANGSRSGPGSPITVGDAKPAIEDVVPLEILQSRMLSMPSISGGLVPSSSSQNFNTLMRPALSGFIGSEKLLRSHVSTLLGCRASVLAEHFATIERELFMGLKFEELVVDDWMRSVEEANVLDWAQFLKDRARYKAESRPGPKTSALVAFRGRFNLCSNFVISEIVLTPPANRHVVLVKFIRFAWKLYERGGFNSLVAVIAALRSEWVGKAAKKSWMRVGARDTRMFNDLVFVTSPGGDFGFLRQEVEAAIEAKPILVTSHDVSTSGLDSQSSAANRKYVGDGKIQPRSFCIPFLGIYLSQLHRHSHLPDLIDPTSPNEPVGIDPVTNAFEAPAYPEVFSTLTPLPSWMQLEPLINVQKQRLIAGVIKSLVTGQHLASKMQYSIDKKLFQKCLKLKALDEDTLQRVLAMYAE